MPMTRKATKTTPMIGNKGARVPGVAADSSKVISVTLAASDILSRWPELDLTCPHAPHGGSQIDGPREQPVRYSPDRPPFVACFSHCAGVLSMNALPHS